MESASTFEVLGNNGEFVSAIAVVVTLIYLATQVRHSRQALDANTRAAEEARLINKIGGESEWMRAWNDVLAEVYATPEKIRLFSRGLADEDLSDEEYMQFSMQIIQILNHHHLSLLMAEHGMRDPHAHKMMEDFIFMLPTSEGGRKWWQKSGWVMGQYGYLNKALEQGVDVPSYGEWEASLFKRPG